jgi:hypothetical protein
MRAGRSFQRDPFTGKTPLAKIDPVDYNVRVDEAGAKG